MTSAEGWYVDPFGLHEVRWFSAGKPTALVRDGGIESRDAPPSTRFSGRLDRIAETAASGADDLRRADQPDADATDAAWALFDETSAQD